MRRDAVRCDARGVATRTDGSNKKFEFAKFVTQPFPAATGSRSATVSRRKYRYRAKECKEPVPGAKLRQVSSRRLVSRGQWIADVDRGQWTRFASTCMAFAAFFEPCQLCPPTTGTFGSTWPTQEPTSKLGSLDPNPWSLIYPSNPRDSDSRNNRQGRLSLMSNSVPSGGMGWKAGAELIGNFLIFKARIFHVPFSPKIQSVLGDTTPKTNASMPFNTAQAPSSGSEPSLQRSSRRSFEAASTPSEKMVPWVTHPGCLELSCFNYTGPQPTTYLPQAFDSSILKLQPGTSNIDEHPPCPWFSCTHRGSLQGKVWFHLLSTSWRHLVVLINQEMTRF